MIHKFVVISLLGLSVSGCATTQPYTPAKIHVADRPSDTAAVQVGPDTVQVLASGTAAFGAISTAITSAQHRIDVEMYEFGRDDIADALIAAKDHHVAVTVIIDPTVSQTASTAMRLEASGISVYRYPVRPMMIDHVKLLVIDGTTAIVGGINWGQTSANNHDFDALIHGPAAANLDRIFSQDESTVGKPVNIPPPQPDPALVVAATLPSTDIRPLALQLIDGARSSIDVQMYVLTDAGIVHALEHAYARGVHVRVLLDPNQRSSDPSVADLSSIGVPTRLYKSHGEKLHAKAIATDGRHVLFGSANWSSGGFVRNHELDVEVLDSPAIAAVFIAAMDTDWNASAM